MKHDKVQVLQAALDYWYVMEFLNQDEFPKAQSPKKEDKTKIPLTVQVEDYGKSLYEIIKSYAKKYQMTRWGNISVYVGKFEREKCIEEITKIFQVQDDPIEQKEENKDKLAWFSFQTEPDLQYIEYSFSLSPMLWAVKKLQNYDGKADDISTKFAKQEYSASIKEYDDFLANIQKEGVVCTKEKKKPEKDKYELDERGEYLKEYGFSVDFDSIISIMNNIEKDYIKDIYPIDQYKSELKKIIEPCIWIKFELYKDQQEWKKNNDESDASLIRPYFLGDLERVRNSAENLYKGSKMHRQLADYIYGQYEPQKMDNIYGRIDMLDAKDDLQEFTRFYSGIFDPKKSPMGKWPSNYMPSFMQQAAINLAIDEGKGPIFSVNGPPGTGKTTLLKEIVVHNIVERAKLLADYKDPDEAFFSYDFKHGLIMTKSGKNVYTSFAESYHGFKKDKINDYSIIVTSYNNAAVENISRELPLEKGITDSLKPGKNDSINMKAGLEQVGKLFTVQENPESEWFQMAEKAKVNNCPKHKERDSHNIYFTAYAKELFGKMDKGDQQDQENDEIWGLISAPLGRKSYINNFYSYVLKDLKFALCNKDNKTFRMGEYEKARKEFQAQLKIVKDMQRELASLNEIDVQKKIEKLHIYLRENLAIQCRAKKNLEEQKREKVRVELLLNNYEDQLLEIENNYEELEREIELLEEKDHLAQQNHNYAIENRARYSSVCILIRIFRRKKLREIKQNYEFWNQKINLCLQEMYQIKIQKDEKEKERGNIKRKQVELAKEVRKIQKQYDAVEEKIGDIKIEIENCDINIRAIEEEIEQKQEEYQLKKSYSRSSEDIETFTWFDQEFIASLVSEDETESARAHVKNPWFTAKYNREREKLFYSALKLQEAFIMASRKFRDNITNLILYWQLELNEANQRVEFKEEDKEAVVMLYQSLSLLVPVISTTFASLGNFFKDVWEDGIGTLIIDEAGQAAPHTAIGALYRSRRAIIVGDPKQIEPVVKDDLEPIKQGYRANDLYKPYAQKNISVQTFADRINSYGTWFRSGGETPEWVGCPLVVHRRCLDPMFRISNLLSYDGIMKNATNLPKESVEKTFIYPESRWIQVEGISKGKKNHFVEEQGMCVVRLLEVAAEKCTANHGEMNIYIISPFTTVKNEMKGYLRKYATENPNSKLTKIVSREWLDKCIGTVHTFQGKEANEVIFLLGCDERSKGAVRWVNKNIVNVAVTRAKYRLYTIGDEEVWKHSSSVSMVIGNLPKYEEKL